MCMRICVSVHTVGLRVRVFSRRSKTVCISKDGLHQQIKGFTLT